jgi:hypothetical protein
MAITIMFNYSYLEYNRFSLLTYNQGVWKLHFTLDETDTQMNRAFRPAALICKGVSIAHLYLRADKNRNKDKL